MNDTQLRMANNVVRLVLIFTICAFISACATAKPMYIPDRESIDCSGDTRGWGDCYRDAEEICRKEGFRILSRSDDSRLVHWERGWYDSSTVIRKMTVECVGSEGLATRSQDIDKSKV